MTSKIPYHHTDVHAILDMVMLEGKTSTKYWNITYKSHFCNNLLGTMLMLDRSPPKSEKHSNQKGKKAVNKNIKNATGKRARWSIPDSRRCFKNIEISGTFQLIQYHKTRICSHMAINTYCKDINSIQSNGFSTLYFL